MFSQTIALFRYQLLGIINSRIIVLLGLIPVVAFLGGQFVAELAILNSNAIALATMADFLRYSLVFMLIMSISYQISQDYEMSQFDRLLAMPLTRVQYVLAQFAVLLVVALVFTLPVYILILLVNGASVALYWTIATYLEMLLVGQFALLAIISLEKLPVAVIFTIAIYLLAKIAPLIELILAQSSPFYDEQSGFQFALVIFSYIQYVLPDFTAFAQNNVLFDNQRGGVLMNQLISVLIYSAFIQFVILIDFYRKEFNQT